MNQINNFLENAAIQNPDKTAVIHDAGKVTYNQLNVYADNLAAYMQANGIKQEDRIALLLENSIDYIIAYYATLKIGAVTAPLNPGLKPDGLSYLFNDLEPAAIITSYKSERLLKAVGYDQNTLKLLIIKTPKQPWQNTSYKVATLEESLSRQPNNPVDSICTKNADSLASIIYTSGSTGASKGVMLSHNNIISNTISICRYLSITEKDIQMVVLPFFYVMGKSLLNTHIAAGATIVLNNRFLYPADVVKQMITENVTSFSGVPSTYAYLLNRSPLAGSKEKLANLRYCSQAGGHMAKATKLALRRALPEFTQIVIMYGATEASARLTYLSPEYFAAKIDSIGKPVPGVSIRILDKEGNEVADGEPGELVASGPNIMQGYWKAPRETSKALDNNGYHTGDIGYRDSEGFLYVQQRKDNILKVAGHRVNPQEIEDFLMATDDLIEAAVVGIPDQLSGNRLVALIVSKHDTITPKMIMKKCATGLPNHKNPATIIPVRALPKNASGKIDRIHCAALASK
jgi:acyl-CoA synthetase (AMP-forming)/AMP-acid ligase II